MAHFPGPYRIEFNDGHPSLHTFGGSPIGEPTFEATSGFESAFTFTIVDSPNTFNLSDPVTFSEQPPSISFQLNTAGNALDIVVNPPDPLPENPSFPFSLNFSNDTSIPDPTIVEKPPIMG